jgi:hypothetical protein
MWRMDELRAFSVSVGEDSLHWISGIITLVVEA